MEEEIKPQQSADTPRCDEVPATLILRLSPDEIRAVAIPDKGASAAELPAVQVVPDGDSPQALLTALESAVYDNPPLLDSYRRLHIIADTTLCSIIPAQATPQALALLRMVHPGDDLHEAVCCTPATANAVVAVGLRRHLAAFIRRTFPEAHLHHPLELLATYFCSRFTAGGNGRRIYVNVRRSRADILVMDRAELLHAVTYPTGAPSDTAYYTLAALNSLSISPMEVEIFVAGETAPRNAVMALLREYASSVMPVIISPASLAAVPADSPLDMKILPLCVS